MIGAAGLNIGDQDLAPSFVAALRAAKPKARVDDTGSAPFEDCLIGGIDPARVRRAFPAADGDRQRTLHYAAHSPVMLAVNTLAPWLDSLGMLTVIGLSGFRDLRFDVPLPALEGTTAQRLPALLVSPGGIIGIAADCAGYVAGTPARLSDGLEAFWQDREENGWRREMLALEADRRRYMHLDAAGLIERYIGLRLLIDVVGAAAVRLPVSLLYLYWEPLNAARFDAFAAHRAEIDRFAGAVAGADIAFRGVSCHDLWAAWSRDRAPGWLAMHLARLHQRYSFRI